MGGGPRPGDRIEIKTVEGVYTGILMSRPELVDANHISIKLDSGYNIGLAKDKIKSFKVVEPKPKGKPEKKPRVAADKTKQTVSILSTGGTISSKVDYRTGGVHATYSAEDLVETLPELQDLANIRAKAVMNVMSEDMHPKLWIKMAEAVCKEINSSDGVVVTQGTDTMHYSTAALSFMLQDLGKPVVFTGSQRSSDRGSSDGFMNLLCGVVAAKNDFSGVSLVMHGSLDDDYCLMHRGTKVRKMHTSRRDAFKSINGVPLAKIYPDNRIEVIDPKHNKRRDSECWVDSKINNKVALIRVYPGMDSGIIDFYLDKDYQGLVLEGTALGHVPTSVKEYSLLPYIERALDSGVVVCMTTQCLYGRVHPHVYTHLRELSSMGVVYCSDMLSEAVYVKLMWVLGHTTDPTEASKMMLENVAGEISEKSVIDLE